MVITVHDGLIRLDFGEHGKIDLPPELALALVSKEQIRSDIRHAVLQARGMIRKREPEASEPRSL